MSILLRYICKIWQFYILPSLLLTFAEYIGGLGTIFGIAIDDDAVAVELDNSIVTSLGQTDWLSRLCSKGQVKVLALLDFVLEVWRDKWTHVCRLRACRT